MAASSITTTIPASQVIWYVDKQTGDNLDRPAFNQMQGDIFNGKIDAVVVYKLDRPSRKMADGITALSSWLDQGIRFVAVTQQFDFTGSVGKLIAAVLLGVAEIEQETRRERQAAGFKIIEIIDALGVTENTVHRYLRQS